MTLHAIPERPICKTCETNPVTRKGSSEKGFPLWANECAGCRKNRTAHRLKKDVCELCGFTALNKCQMDLDHIDGDSTNDDPKNLQTLCSNCHRLKTFCNRDWQS